MKYSPHNLLPAKHPKEQEFKNQPTFFYDNVVKHLIPDILKIANNGIPINLDKVKVVEETVNNVLNEVEKELSINPMIQEFIKEKQIFLKQNKLDFLNTKQKNVTEFIKSFNYDDIIHRTYIINTYLKSINKYNEFYMNRWTIKDIKKVNNLLGKKFLDDFIDKLIPIDNKIILQGMLNLAQDKANIFNKKILQKIDNFNEKNILIFNPNSSVQKQEFFNWLDIESETETKAGNDSFNKKELDRLLQLVNILIEEIELPNK